MSPSLTSVFPRGRTPAAVLALRLDSPITRLKDRYRREKTKGFNPVLCSSFSHFGYSSQLRKTNLATAKIVMLKRSTALQTSQPAETQFREMVPDVWHCSLIV